MSKKSIDELFEGYQGDYVPTEMDQGEDIPDIPFVRDPSTGRLLTPGHPKLCLSSGDFPGFNRLCGKCGFFHKCFLDREKEH